MTEWDGCSPYCYPYDSGSAADSSLSDFAALAVARSVEVTEEG
ncbi:MAG TPA: hypothetical protein VFR13_01300 [Jiangellaceae bacterium]|nr:hypothetical protein [Jiangellaceae bacterium]